MLFFFIVRVRTFSFWLRSNRKHYSTAREWQYIGFRNLHEVDVNLTHYGYGSYRPKGTAICSRAAVPSRSPGECYLLAFRRVLPFAAVDNINPRSRLHVQDALLDVPSIGRPTGASSPRPTGRSPTSLSLQYLTNPK